MRSVIILLSKWRVIVLIKMKEISHPLKTSLDYKRHCAFFISMSFQVRRSKDMIQIFDSIMSFLSCQWFMCFPAVIIHVCLFFVKSFCVHIGKLIIVRLTLIQEVRLDVFQLMLPLSVYKSLDRPG